MAVVDNSDLFYHNGETITAGRIQDEPWYSDYQFVAEVLCAGQVDNGKPSFYERLPDGFELAKQRCFKRFQNVPGPVHLGWEPPSEERLERWIQSMWLHETQMAAIERVEEEELNLLCDLPE